MTIFFNALTTDRGLALKLIPAALLALVGGYATMAAVFATGSDEPGFAEPSRFLPGDLDREAARQAQAFNEFPVLWLGEEYEGYRLVEFIRLQRPNQNAVVLIYGTCKPLPGVEGGSCVPPISVISSAPGSIPQPEAFEPTVSGPVGTSRGVRSRVASGGRFLWTESVIATVHANPEDREAATDQLRTANAAVVGVPEVRAGQDLTPLNR